MKTYGYLTFGTFALAVGLAATMMLGCSKKEAEQEPVVTVQVAKAERGEIKQIIRNQGVLFARNQAAITPKIVAPVRTFYVNRGSRVHTGQLLAVLENRDLAASEVENKGTFEQAQATYGLETSSALPEEWQKAEYDLKTAKEAYDAEQKVYDSRRILYQEGAMPRKDFDQSAVSLIQAKAQYEIAQRHVAALESAGKKDQLKSAKGQLTSAEGKYAGAAAQLAYSEIHSPIDGVVTDRPVYPGETPAAGTPLLIIMDTSSVIARTHIPQEEAAVLKIGDTATLTASSDVQATGKVTLISPALDPNSTTVEVWIEAPNPEGRLRPGTSMTLEILARTIKDAIVVPAPALLKTPDGGNAVMIVKADRAHQVGVKTGIREGDRLQITEGIVEGDSVIVTGAYGLPDNTKVKIAEAAPAEKTDKPASPDKPTSDNGKD
jgi:RND family efflux transporter MFP subunit